MPISANAEVSRSGYSIGSPSLINALEAVGFELPESTVLYFSQTPMSGKTRSATEALVESIAREDENGVRIALAAGGDPNVRIRLRQTPMSGKAQAATDALVESIERGDETGAQAALAAGGEPNVRIRLRQTAMSDKARAEAEALMDSIERGDERGVRIALAGGGAPNLRIRRSGSFAGSESSTSRSVSFERPLIWVVLYGWGKNPDKTPISQETLRALLRAGANPCVRCPGLGDYAKLRENNKHPIYSRWGAYKALDDMELVDPKAPGNHEEAQRFRALYAAVQKNDGKAVEGFLAEGGWYESDLVAAASFAAEWGSPSCLLPLINSLSDRGLDEADVLSGASLHGDLPAVKAVVERRSNDLDLDVGLKSAALGGHPDCMALLLARGANPGDEDGLAWKHAVASGSVACVQVLLSVDGIRPAAGPSRHLQGPDILQAAMESRNPLMVAEVLAHVQNPDSREEALRSAALGGYREAVSVLWGSLPPSKSKDLLLLEVSSELSSSRSQEEAWAADTIAYPNPNAQLAAQKRKDLLGVLKYVVTCVNVPDMVAEGRRQKNWLALDGILPLLDPIRRRRLLEEAAGQGPEITSLPFFREALGLTTAVASEPSAGVSHVPDPASKPRRMGASSP